MSAGGSFDLRQSRDGELNIKIAKSYQIAEFMLVTDEKDEIVDLSNFTNFKSKFKSYDDKEEFEMVVEKTSTLGQLKLSLEKDDLELLSKSGKFVITAEENSIEIPLWSGEYEILDEFLREIDS